MKLVLTCLGIIQFFFCSFAQELRVKNNRGMMVPCDVTLVGHEGVLKKYQTDKFGVLILENIDCQKIKSVVIEAFSSKYKKPFPISCDKIGEIIIPTVLEFSNLTKNYVLYSTYKNDSALKVSLLAGTELAEIARNSQLISSDSVERQVLKLAASYFQINHEEALYEDPLQENKIVASDVLIDAVKAYQKSNSLKETGMLDIKTIMAISELKPTNVIFREVKKESY